MCLFWANHGHLAIVEGSLNMVRNGVDMGTPGSTFTFIPFGSGWQPKQMLVNYEVCPS